MEKLTNAEWVWSDTDLGFLAGIRVDIENMPLERAVQPQEEHESILVLEQRGKCRLSPETRRREEERLASLSRKKRALRSRKKYTRKVGRVHPKKKAATLRRRLAKRWAENPFGCVIHGYGAYALDRKLWDAHVAPLWLAYNPAELVVKRAVGYGTKAKPYTIYSLQVVHKPTGQLLFDGNSQLLYDQSKPSVEPELLA